MDFRKIRGGYKLIFADETEFKDIVDMFESIKNYIQTKLGKDEEEFFCFNKAISDLLRLHRIETENDEEGNEMSVVSSAIFENMYINFFEMAFISCAFLQGEKEYIEFQKEYIETQKECIEAQGECIDLLQQNKNLIEERNKILENMNIKIRS